MVRTSSTSKRAAKDEPAATDEVDANANTSKRRKGSPKKAKKASTSTLALETNAVTKPLPPSKDISSPATDAPSSKRSKQSTKKSPTKKAPKGAGKAKKAPASAKAPPSADEDELPKKAPAKKKAPAHQVLTERDAIPKLWSADDAAKKGSYTLKIASWNVAGLRALLKRNPDALSDLVKKHDLDILCLQEIKLQEKHLDDPKDPIRGQLLDSVGFDEYYSCSTARKGYSGTAVFVKRHSKKGSKQKKVTNYFASAKGSSDVASVTDSLPVDAKLLMPVETSYKIGVEKHDEEGRVIVMDFPSFSFANVYVPNSGQALARLSYRTDEWDKDFLAFMQKKQAERGVPVMWLGDLNVAHTNLEVWNDGAKHLAKQAGVTAEERASFQEQLDAGFIDAFRKLHPEAKGHYSYWSQRAGNREPNKGLRLDYFICDPKLFDESSSVLVRDSYMDHAQEGSDHCPVILEVEIRS